MKVELCNCEQPLCSVCNPTGACIPRIPNQNPTTQEIATTLQVVSAAARPHSHVSHATVRLVGGSAEVCECGMVALTPRDGATGEWVTVAEACRRMTTGQWHDVRAHVDEAKVEKKATVVHVAGERRCSGLIPPLCGAQGMWPSTGVVNVFGHMCSEDITRVNCQACQTAFIKLPDGE